MIELFKKDEYSSDKYQFTAIRDPRLKKDKAYYIQKCESIYSPYVRDLCSLPAFAGRTFQFLREFADGMQPESRYKKIVKRAVNEMSQSQEGVVIDTEEAMKKGYWNVFWTILPRAPLIVSNLVGLFSSVDYKVSADPIDRNSKNLIEDAEMELWALTENQDFLKAYDKLAGLKHEEPDFVPESQDEMDVYKQMGGFKPLFAKSMEKCIKHTENVSEWKEVKKLMDRDAVVINVKSCKDYYDPEDNLIKTKYIDPATMVIQWSLFPDHHDANYAGHLDTMNISELRQWIPDREESFYRDIAFAVCGYSGNPAANRWKEYNLMYSNGTYGYDFFKVLYAEFEWIDIDSKKEIIFKNRWGREVSKEIEYNTKPEDFMPQIKTEDKVLRFTDIRKRFQAKWIVGTDEVFDWGPAYDVIRPTKKDVSLTYHVYSYPGISIIQRLIPILDSFQILWLKLQNAIAYSRNEGGLFNASAIASVAKTKDEQKQWIQGFLEAGYQFFMETSAMQMRNTSMQPFFPIPGGMGKQFADLVAAIDFNLKLVEHITGFNPIALGATPDKEAPVGTQKISVASMSNTLKDYVTGTSTLIKQWAENITRWIQISVKTNPYARKAYSAAISDFDIELLRTAEGDAVSYGISLVPLPNDLQKQQVYEQIKIGLDKNNQNLGGITQSDALVLTTMIEGEVPLKEVAFEFSMREKKNTRLLAQIKKQQVQDQQNAINQEKKASHDLDMERDKKLHDYKTDELKQEGENLTKSRAVPAAINAQASENVAHIKKEAQTTP